jgi:hypothetical protein
VARSKTGAEMPEGSTPITEARYIEAPCDSRLRALYDYWDARRGGRAMPARADIDPAAIPGLLPYVFMYGAAPEGGYTVRLVGEAVVDFVGRNATGNPAGIVMPSRSAEMIVRILDTVTSERAPKFRAGKTHWLAEKSHRDYEACFLPLSADGDTVNIVLCGLSFSRPAAAGG